MYCGRFDGSTKILAYPIREIKCSLRSNRGEETRDFSSSNEKRRRKLRSRVFSPLDVSYFIRVRARRYRARWKDNDRFCFHPRIFMKSAAVHQSVQLTLIARIIAWDTRTRGMRFYADRGLIRSFRLRLHELHHGIFELNHRGHL